MNLLEYRTKLGLSQDEAAKQLGVTKSAYCRWENGIRVPRRENVREIGRWSQGAVTPGDFY